VFAALAANTQKFAACGELWGVCKRELGKALPANPETPKSFSFQNVQPYIPWLGSRFKN
jgi:hypothetical protein